MPTWERVTDLDDPNRCQGVMPTIGQCRNKAAEGSLFCYAHGGNKGVEAKKQREMKNYRLAKFRSRAEELGNSEHITSLKDEVALLRMLIEERINSLKDTQELLLCSGPLSDLLMKVATVVEKCHKLDSKLGNLLDRSKVVQFAQIVVEIISSKIDDPKILDQISSEILQSLKET